MKVVDYRQFQSLLSTIRVVENGRPADLPLETKVYIEFSTDRYYRTYKDIASHLAAPGKKVLDIAANPFYTAALMHLTSAEYTSIAGGYYIDGTAVKKQEEIVSTQIAGQTYSVPMQTGYNFERDNLPYADNSFDMVLLLEVIEHYCCDPVFALKEIARVLKPDGLLILTTDNANTLIKIFKILSYRSIYHQYSTFAFSERHAREYLPYEIEQLLCGIGYRDVKVHLRNLMPYSKNLNPVKRKVYSAANLLTSLPFFGRYKRHIVAFAKKGDAKDYYPGWLFMGKEGWVESMVS